MPESRIPSLDDFEGAEHCVLEDVTVQHPALTTEAIRQRDAREVSGRHELRDKLRGRRTVVTLFEEGWLDVAVERRGKSNTHHRIDLRYLDPVPSVRRYHPIRLLKAAGILGGITALFAIPASLGWLAAYSIPATIIAGLATFGALFVAYYLTHEKIDFVTMHGRAQVIRFGAGLGTIKKFRKLVPVIVDAIGNAVESINDETAVYLRAEMREHYRLRNEGILSESQCAESTGKILGSFDGPL